MFAVAVDTVADAAEPFETGAIDTGASLLKK